jgi:predicted DNA-binding transcriptional regulator AlpA
MYARRILTFRELKPRKGWPYSRQHTHRLIRAGRFPRPRKLPGGGLLNIWDEDVIDAFLASITDADESPPDAPRRAGEPESRQLEDEILSQKEQRK